MNFVKIFPLFFVDFALSSLIIVMLFFFSGAFLYYGRPCGALH